MKRPRVNTSDSSVKRAVHSIGYIVSDQECLVCRFPPSRIASVGALFGLRGVCFGCVVPATHRLPLRTGTGNSGRCATSDSFLSWGGCCSVD